MDRRAKYDVGGGGGGGGKSFRSSDGGGEYGKAWKTKDPLADSLRQKLDIKEMTANMRREKLDQYFSNLAKNQPKIEESSIASKPKFDKGMAAVGGAAAAGAGYAASREKASKNNPTGKAEVRIKKKGSKEKDYEE